MPAQSNEDQELTATRQQLIDAADQVFHANGVTAYLEGRDIRWRATLEEAIARAGDDARSQLLAFFDALGTWHDDPQCPGYSFANAAAELTASHPAHAVVDAQKRSLRQRMTEIADRIPHSAPTLLVDQLMMLLEGVMATHALGTVTHPVDKARMTAAVLIYSG